MRFSFMSGMAFRIATLKRSWKKEGLMLIMPHSIVGLSVMRQPLLQKLNLRNETQIDLGAWMKRVVTLISLSHIALGKEVRTIAGIETAHMIRKGQLSCL
jgi:hypothetical protein